ncbi:two component, sigma54 specific, transcriptional regulator, Fis family [Anaeromyxobacter sp. K]|uniref:sigma-54-dependent transcriptional regulator n=1 Tax=Anaeromyxobacter sp. (strain K) TaxID=447217 RepID=UPI00015F89A6|nr:sigma-54 dependent transcriptional regulator [Anaeromyxobacter sp. K]ACG72096.1 two component, sigma54 specific, transcriptional regulator, Fis family [Anaeromyxobacter sp. K]
MKRDRILVIDGNPLDGAGLRAALCERGFDAVEAASAERALGLVPSFQPAAVLADVTLPGCEAGELVGRLRELGSDAAVVVAAPHDRLEAAVQALRAGAESFLVRPVDAGQALVVLQKALEKRGLRRDRAELRERVRARAALVGTAPEMQGVVELVRRVAPTKATVLVLGESGTGKEHVAQALHEASPRRDRPFVRVNCAALSEALLESDLFGHEPGAFADSEERHVGKLELADGGTLYLHEVGSLPPPVQVKLLRVLQQGEMERMGGRETLRVDVRVVAGAQHDLAEEVRAGRFRDDLYYRLNVVAVALPPLRERKGDIPALVNHFLEVAARTQGSEVVGVTPGTLSALFAYDWPGNVRELASVVEHAVSVARGREITAEDLSPVLHGARPEESGASALIPGATLFEIEREAILRTLEQCGGSTARAAEVLGVSVRKIQYRLKEYRSGVPGRRPPELEDAYAEAHK